MYIKINCGPFFKVILFCLIAQSDNFKQNWARKNIFENSIKNKGNILVMNKI